ncbi:MAG: acyl-CoA dehydrogenase family protein [Euryarchaeota archaeon]|nr:acyl-CoA dehydrogenase family protein [Euryarchaeota archaeon]MDE1835885.1 acyl-CoA dehydrogenase family protein [Euryarchaeota archaeon]MDE1881392.1 acyl-CoA dehydrogenase family protein [Euryarchaeota archaeon]MDE2044437.1 acyl-CoA dehydrogenase family protein [Thermoplasmata archaeon]
MPIGFELTAEQKELQALAAKFAKEEMAPRAAECDKKGLFPEDIYRRAWELGLMNLNVATEYGGSGLALLDQCIIAEELAAACGGMTTSILANCLALQPINLAGTPEQKERILKPFCADYHLASFGLTEPSGGSDAAALKTRAEKKGDHYVLNGQKCFITNAPQASLFTVFATLDPEKRDKGITAFIVPRDSPGLSIGKEEDKMGQRASSTATVIFEDVKVPEQNLLGKEGEGFRVGMMTLDSTRTPIGALACGIARAALDHAAKYSLERTSFGKPIAQHQAIAAKLANMAIELEASRLLTWRSAWLVDHGHRASLESSIAKCFSSDAAMRICDEAIQVFGGYGYMKDYPVEKYLRDAKLCQIYEGANEIQRQVIAREFLRRFA